MKPQLAVTLLAALQLLGTGAESQEIVTLADPTKPAELTFEMPYSIVHVVGRERSDIAVEIEDLQPGASRVVVPALALGNRVEVRHPLNQVLVSVRIEVPRRTNLNIFTSNAGLVRVEGVYGEIQIENSNAGVELDGVGGSVAVSTSNGHISARIAELYENAVVSLFTSNGEISLTLQKDFSGKILAESDTGVIESDFTVVPEPAVGVTRPGRVLSGRIGEGGHLLRLRTDNAGIRILRSE